MAIYPEKFFLGTTTTTVIDTATNIAAANFSGAPAAVYDNTTDATVPYARWAKCVLFVNDWAAAPVQGTTIDLFGVLQDVDSTNDDTDAPSGTTIGGARLLGSWTVAGVDAAQRRTIIVDMLGIEKVNCYIRNNTAQQMTNSVVNCTVKVTPLAYGFVV